MPKLLFLAPVLALAGFRLWLTSADEIVARPMPQDQLLFARLAAHLIDSGTLGPYDHLTLVREPAYPLWVAAVHVAGLRLHTATELLLLGGALTFAVALRRRSTGWLGLAAFALLVVEPSGVYWNTELRAETLYTPLLLLFLAGLVALVRPEPRPALAAGTGLALALLWQTRPEGAALLPLLAAAGGLVLRAARRDRVPWAGALRRAAVVALLPLLPVAVLDAAVRGWNAGRYGLAVVSELRSPGYLAARRALLRIRPDRIRRWVAVPADVRERAYEASPSFAELRPHLEGDLGRSWRDTACFHSGLCDEIATGWFFWALRDAVAAAGHSLSAPEQEAFYASVAAEIDGAIAEGRLQARAAPTSFLDPDTAAWLPYLPGSLLRVASVLHAPAPLPEKDPADRPGPVRALFDRVARRDGARAAPLRRVARGWFHRASDPLERLIVRDARGAEVSSQWRARPRPGVAGRLRARGYGDVPAGIGFVLTLEAAAEPLSVVFVSRHGEETATLLGPQRVLGPRSAWAIDSVDEVRAFGRAQRSAQVRLRALFRDVTAGLSLSALAAVLVTLVSRRTTRSHEPPDAALLLIGLLVTGRVAVFGVLDAALFPADDSRYFYPVAGLYAFGLLLLCARVVRTLPRGPLAAGLAGSSRTEGAAAPAARSD